VAEEEAVEKLAEEEAVEKLRATRWPAEASCHAGGGRGAAAYEQGV